MRYSVIYEIEVFPSPVEVEIICKDLADQEEVYQGRLNNCNCKHLKKKKTSVNAKG